MKKISFLLVILLAFASVSYAQKKEKKKKKDKTEKGNLNKKVVLRYKPKKGDVYTQILESNQKITITSMSMEMPMVQSYTFKNNVTDVDATGNVTTEMTYEKIYAKQSNPMTGAELEFDSEDEKKQSTELASLKDMKGKKVTTTTATNGKITNISEESAKQALNSMSNEFPETPLGIGDTWEKTSENKSQVGVLVTKSTYKVVERKDGLMIVEVSSVISQDGKDAGTQTGKMTLDENTGIVLESSLTQKLSVSTQGMDIVVDGTSKITTKK
jgi:ribosomal protein L18